MDALAALRLQVEWGADEALLETPSDRFAPAVAPATALSRSAAPPPPATAQGPARALAAPSGLAATVAAAADSFAALQAAIDSFDACPLRATASRTVVPDGDPGAGLVLVGEAPGADDDRSGRAFSGAVGAALDRVLGSAGLGRDAMLLSFLVPWRPPGGRAPSESEIATCLPFMHRLLALARPRRVVLLGAGPLRALTGETGGLRQARGRWTHAVVPGLPEPVAALPMLAPELWLKTGMNKQAAWVDALALQEALSSG